MDARIGDDDAIDDDDDDDVFFIDAFARRQWRDEKYSGTRVTAVTEREFVREVARAHASGEATMRAGYAPFCKHVFVRNFIDANVGTCEITERNEMKLRTGYGARAKGELAVLTRWFAAKDVERTRARWLDVILYSREQLEKERAAMGKVEELPRAPWGIISIKAQDEDYETPMQPITMMRNALGKDQGGSGVALDRDKYEASVRYWSTRAPIVEGDQGASGD